MDFGWLQGAGTLIGGLGTVYGAHNQNEQFKKMNKMHKDTHNKQKECIKQ